MPRRKMAVDISSISPYLPAVIVAIAALLVGALNQRHHALEKRLDELYSPLFPFVSGVDKSSFPVHRSESRMQLLELLHAKNYLMSPKLQYIYWGHILPLAQKGVDAFPDYWLDEFIRTVREDYANLRNQYLSFWKLLFGLFKPNPLKYSPSDDLK